MVQKLEFKDGDETVTGYEFVAFGLATEIVDGQLSIYNVIICKDEQGYLEEIAVSKVRFV